MKRVKDLLGVLSIKDNVVIIKDDGTIVKELTTILDLPYAISDYGLMEVRPGVVRNEDGSYSGYFIVVVR